MSTPVVEEESVSFYAVYDDGSIGQLRVPAGAPEPVLSKPGRLVDEEEFQDALDAIKAEAAQQAAADDAARRALAKADYDALVAAGIPDASARRLSGHTGS